MKKRKLPLDRKREILEASLTLARTVGYDRVTRDALAASVGCSAGLVSKYFSTMPQLKRAIVSAAVAERDLVVLAQALAARESKALAASPELKAAALRGLL